MFNSVSIGNFALAVLKNGSMQQLWGLIRSIQIIVLSSLIELVYPSNVSEFFKQTIEFANVDLLSGEDLYEKWLEMEPTSPLSAKFSELDYETKNFLLNSGSFFVMLTFVLLEPILRALINLLCLACRRYELSRQIGLRMSAY